MPPSADHNGTEVRRQPCKTVHSLKSCPKIRKTELKAMLSIESDAIYGNKFKIIESYHDLSSIMIYDKLN